MRIIAASAPRLGRDSAATPTPRSPELPRIQIIPATEFIPATQIIPAAPKPRRGAGRPGRRVVADRVRSTDVIGVARTIVRLASIRTW